MIDEDNLRPPCWQQYISICDEEITYEMLIEMIKELFCKESDEYKERIRDWNEYAKELSRSDSKKSV